MTSEWHAEQQAHEFGTNWHGRRYLTNISRRMMDLVAEAIAQSGRRDIHIDQDVVPGSRPEPDWFSIYADSDCDCSDFWKVYQDLRDEPRWKIYLAMTRDD